MSEKSIDLCIEYIQKRIGEEKLQYAQYTEEFAAALVIGMEAGVKISEGEFNINNENDDGGDNKDKPPKKGTSLMTKFTKYFTSSLLVTTVLLLSACNGTTPVKLPEEFIKCESRLTGEVFKYKEKNATVFPDAFCVNQNCVNIYEINDLSGNRVILNEHEIRDEWVCSVINN